MTTQDRIKGAIYGFAFGNALGVGTEFMTRIEARFYYPDGLRKFNNIIRDAHRALWKPGQWTIDTELLINSLNSILDWDEFKISHIAKGLMNWYEHTDSDISPVLRVVLKAKGWVDYPIATAHKIWQTRGLVEASNDAIHRGIVTGLLSTAENLDEHTRQIVLMTNDDTRCVSTTTVIARMVHSLLNTGEAAPYEDLYELCCSLDSRTIPFLKMAHEGTLEEMELDDEDTMSWTRKTMASALWTVWHCDNVEDAIYKIIDSAGDADSNAAIAGALAGLRFGYDALPPEKENLLNKELLDELVERVCAYHDSKSAK